MSNMTNKLPEVYLPTRIEIDESIHPSLKGSGAYLIFSELAHNEMTQLKDKIIKSKSLKESGVHTLTLFSKHFIEGKLPKKEGLFDVTKEYILSGKLPAKILTCLTSVLVAGVLPKKEKTVSAN